MQDNDTITRAGFGPRAAAFLIDRLLLALALVFVRLPAVIAALFGYEGFAFRAFLFRYSALDVLCWALSAAYFILLTYFTGSTLGKKVMRLRVERADGEPLRLIDVIYRETVGRFLSGILCIGYIMALADKEKRAFHDWLCGTRVVYEDTSFRRREPKPAPAYTAPGEDGAPALPDAPAVSYTVPGAYTIPGAAVPPLPEPEPDISETEPESSAPEPEIPVPEEAEPEDALPHITESEGS